MKADTMKVNKKNDLFKTLIVAIGVIFIVIAMLMEISITLFKTSKGILTSDYTYVRVENASYRKTDLNLYQINGKVNGKKFNTVSNDSVNKPKIGRNKTIVIYNTHINSFNENYYYNNKEERQKAYSKYNKKLKEENNIVSILIVIGFVLIALPLIITIIV